MKDFMYNETLTKLDNKQKELEAQIEEIDYIKSIIKDMQYYCRKRDDEYNYIRDENDEYILEYPTDPYAIHEYEKRRNVVDIVVKSYFK